MFNTTPVVLMLVFVGLSWSLFSLWENLPQWRTPRQTEEGIFHRWLTALCFRWFCFYMWLSVALCKLHKNYRFPPAWLVNLSPWCAPDVVRQIGAREYMRRNPELYEQHGGSDE